MTVTHTQKRKKKQYERNQITNHFTIVSSTASVKQQKQQRNNHPCQDFFENREKNQWLWRLWWAGHDDILLGYIRISLREISHWWCYMLTPHLQFLCLSRRTLNSLISSLLISFLCFSRRSPRLYLTMKFALTRSWFTSHILLPRSRHFFFIERKRMREKVSINSLPSIVFNACSQPHFFIYKG